MASKELSRGDEQAELALVRRAESNEVPMEMIRRQRTAAAAFALAIQSSGLEDKEVYSSLGIDPGYFSRIKKGEATLQVELIPLFCEIVGNRIYPEWIAFQLGCTLVLIQSEAEKRAEIAERRASEAEMKVRVLMEALAGKVTA